MSLRGWIRKLERSSKGELVSIPQEDGSIACFHPDDLAEAFLANQRRLRGEDHVPLHPLTVAATNSSEAKWRESFFSEMRVIDHDGEEEIADLSEL